MQASWWYKLTYFNETTFWMYLGCASVWTWESDICLHNYLLVSGYSKQLIEQDVCNTFIREHTFKFKSSMSCAKINMLQQQPTALLGCFQDICSSFDTCMYYNLPLSNFISLPLSYLAYQYAETSWLCNPFSMISSRTSFLTTESYAPILCKPDTLDGPCYFLSTY